MLHRVRNGCEVLQKGISEVQTGQNHSPWSVMEESEAGVNQSDAQLVTGFNHHLISSRAGGSRDELNAALRETQGQTVRVHPGPEVLDVLCQLPVWPDRCYLWRGRRRRSWRRRPAGNSSSSSSLRRTAAPGRLQTSTSTPPDLDPEAGNTRCEFNYNSWVLLKVEQQQRENSKNVSKQMNRNVAAVSRKTE